MHGRFRTSILVVSALLVVLLIAGCKSSNLVSESQEIDIGRQTAHEIEKRYPVSKDDQLNAMVDDIGQYLAARSDRPNLKYTFKVLDIKDVNAVSLPGGWVYVYKGLIDMIGGPQNVNKDILAGVIGHEIGHISARHAAEQITRQTYYGIGIGVLTRGRGNQYANIAANLNLLRWSRKDEYESDKLGIKYTYGSTYKPEGIIQFLEALEKEKGSSRSLAFLKTHPVPADRVERAQKYLDELKAKGGG